ncbi:MAG: hypothetical protein KDD83_12400 [Caldilineaceae bacterium]|nr:hypothetical protein [Caldilineaceae bacterium]
MPASASEQRVTDHTLERVSPSPTWGDLVQALRKVPRERMACMVIESQERSDRAIGRVNYRMGDGSHRDTGFGTLAAGLRLIQRLAVVRHE